MSEYTAYDDPLPRRERRTKYRPRDYDDPEYVEETTFIERGKGPPPRELVLRQREDSVEDIPRDFPPPNSRRGPPRGYDDDYSDYSHSRRARSTRGRHDDDDYSDDGYAAAGAAGGYAAARRWDRSRGPRSDYYSDEDEPPRRERRKSGLEKFAEGVGLGGVVGAITGKDDERRRSRSRSRAGRYEDESPPRSRDGRGGVKERQWAQAAQAALVSGAIEAFRVRNGPGGWGGEKAKRIATAAIGAGAIDKVIDRDPEKKSTRHLVEAVIGGLVANRLANGARENEGSRSRGRDRSRSSSRRSRSRSVFSRFRSKSRGRSASRGRDGSRSPSRSKSNGAGLAGLAGVGALAAAGKAWYDRARSKSRGPNGRRRSTSSDRDDYGRSRSRRRDVGRSRSLPPEDRADSRAVDGPRGRAIGSGAAAGAIAAHNPDGGEDRGKRDSSTSSESSNEIENKRKKMRGKELLTAGLASIATIHAAHGVYQSMEASEKRHKLVAEGEMSKEEARRKRSKAWLQDAAAIGIAALGIKGAYSEWKEMNEQRHSVKELEERRRKRAKRREQRMREARMGGGRPQGRLPPSDGYYGNGGGYGDESLPPPPIGQTAGGYR